MLLIVIIALAHKNRYQLGHTGTVTALGTMASIVTFGVKKKTQNN
jgi:hypothetical protein